MVSTELTSVLLVLSVLLLGIGAWQDLKTREVADWIWLSMIGAGILVHGLILLIRMVLGEEVIGYFMPWVINIIFAFILAIFLTILGLGGEADRIAFIAIAVITPISHPLLVFSNPTYELLLSFVPKIFGVFCNAYLITLPIPLLLFLYNILYQFRYPDFYDLSYESSKWRRLSIRFIGYPHSTQFLANDFKQKPWHYDFLEEFDEETGWQMVFRARLDTPEADLARKQKTISTINLKNKDSIWIQPNLPFIFILMFAYLLEIIWGNLLLFWMSFVF
ncbi:MAG: A24 family peptidase C-terminal domain-containing protein [Candidatus Hodarchaeota archaeon]